MLTDDIRLEDGGNRSPFNPDSLIDKAIVNAIVIALSVFFVVYILNMGVALWQLLL